MSATAVASGATGPSFRPYLTFWMVFALAVLWGAAMVVLRGLDWLWVRLGWGLETDLYPFWASIFRAAEAFVIF